MATPTRRSGVLASVDSVTPVRLVLAEDNLLVRRGLVSLLETSGDIELVAACESFDELVAAVDKHQPDVVLTDIRMPPDHSDEGVRAAEIFRDTHPTMGVVVISQFAEPEYVLAVLGEGSRGRGYVVKDRIDDRSHLLAAISSVVGGGSFIDDEVINVLIQSRARTIDSPLDALSRREREVLAEIASGKNNAAIADALLVSHHAVEKHSNAIFAKLGLTEEEGMNRRVTAVLLFLAGQDGSKS